MGAWRHALGREKSALTPTNIGLVRGADNCIKTRVRNNLGWSALPSQSLLPTGVDR